MERRRIKRRGAQSNRFGTPGYPPARRSGVRSASSTGFETSSDRLRRGEPDEAGVVRLSNRKRVRAGGKHPARRSVPRSGGESRRVGRGRIRICVLLFALIGAFLTLRALQLSLVDGEWLGIIEGDRVETAASVGEPAPERGAILSADGRQLATTLVAARVVATPYQVEDPEKTAEQLALVLGRSKQAVGVRSAPEIEAKLSARDRSGELVGYSVILSRIEPELAREVRDLNLPGIAVVEEPVRVYPHGALASQATGYLGNYGESFGGVEARYEEELESGQDVQLTIDAAVQQELETALVETVGQQGAKSGLGVVMRVEDGALVALANVPRYDNNHFPDASPEAQRDRVLTDPYEPGSTFKPFTYAAALEEGVISGNSVYTVPDSIAVADRVIHDSMPHETMAMTPGEILRRSSNVGTVQVAQDLGGEPLSAYLEQFGFGSVTGVDLWGEAAGFVPPHADWSGVSIGNIPIGQGLTVTPLQLAAGYATLANGGLKVNPYVAQTSVEDARERVISEDTSSIVRGMLQSVVDEGTGRRARIPGYSVAGKTGTAQKVDPGTGTYGDEYVTSFIGFAPASNPQYVILIVVDEPQESIWGESVAAPVFQEVMSFTLSYFNVPPDRPRFEGNPGAGGAGSPQYASEGNGV